MNLDVSTAWAMMWSTAGSGFTITMSMVEGTEWRRLIEDERALYQRAARSVGWLKTWTLSQWLYRIERIRLSWDHLEPDNGDGAGGVLLGEEVDCIEVELTGSLYDLFNDGCTFGELGSFVGCMYGGCDHTWATQLSNRSQVTYYGPNSRIAHITCILMRYSLGSVCLHKCAWTVMYDLLENDTYKEASLSAPLIPWTWPLPAVVTNAFL
jgi:hypothetical protein